MSIDYQAELNRVESFTGDFLIDKYKDYWKPIPSKYDVTAVGELEDALPVTFKEGEAPQERMNLAIEVLGKKFIWDFPKGKTKASTYGQLLALAVKNGKLNGIQFKVIVIGEGQLIRYTIDY